MRVESSPRQHKPIPLGLRCRLALQVSQALGYLHGRHVIHFDVKPEQILVHFTSPPISLGSHEDRNASDLLDCDECGVSARLIDYGMSLRFTSDQPFINAELDNGGRYRGASSLL